LLSIDDLSAAAPGAHGVVIAGPGAGFRTWKRQSVHLNPTPDCQTEAGSTSVNAWQS